jgi:hypothetical protein
MKVYSISLQTSEKNNNNRYIYREKVMEKHTGLAITINSCASKQHT